MSDEYPNAMVIVMLLALAGPHETRQRVGALLRFVARVDDVESDEQSAREQIERDAAAVAIVREIELSAPAGLDAARRLREAVRAGRQRDISRLAGELQAASGFDAIPRRQPRLDRGAKLYAQSCAACHGAGGQPPSGNPLQLATPPISFVDPRSADRLSPQRIFDAVTAGIPETPMPAFDDAFTDDDRWAIAFYVQALRHAPAPARPSRWSLEDVALASDALLRAQLEAAGTTPSELEPALASLRWHPPRRHRSSRLALVVPDWLAPVALRSERAGIDAVSVDLVLDRPNAVRRQDLLVLINLVARQALLRSPVPLTDLSVNLYEEGAGAPIARCALVRLSYYECGVAPPGG